VSVARDFVDQMVLKKNGDQADGRKTGF
jgi:hypothetical protein